MLDSAAHGAALCSKGDLNGASPYFYTRWGTSFSLFSTSSSFFALLPLFYFLISVCVCFVKIIMFLYR